ncbi:methyltransferase [uncultured Draconibacterium sp.]|uniref:tRNA1(Val) (adenine(37)-N6)-methyltransferase n=1 Tax=uncultured Draconibacterium sp. TaxID=1573823 RepID=UPI00326165BC
MGNNYFRFKQFTIHQEKAAMKVGIDGVLLGSWAKVNNCRLVLDVGTGTGLIALMLAQQSSAKIMAIDVEGNAVIQAQQNVQASPWAEQIQVRKISFQELINDDELKFDLLVSNPPFFQHSLKAGTKERTLARHTDSLPYSVLIEGASRMLSENGRCAFIFPKQAEKEIEHLAEKNNLFLQRKTWVQPKHNKTVNRVLFEFGRNKANVISETLVIYENDGTWTTAFKALTSRYYLKA